MGGVDLRRARLAVDVGASNVKMAWFQDGRIVDSSSRRVDFPAVVAVRCGDLLIGTDAHAMSATDPAALLLDVREWLGVVPSVRLAGVEVPIDDAVSALYRAAARATIGTTDNMPAAIVHPASWPERRVQLLTAAAGDAGLDVVHVVADAIAVASAGPTKGDVLVIDVGASLTVSVIDTASQPPRILWSRMSTGAGGDAIAQAIRAVTSVPVGRARELARGAAPVTSEMPLDWTAIRSAADEGHVAARDLINDVLRSSNRDGGDIARVYVTGGASVAPFIREAVRNRFGDKVAEFAGPAASAAYGALRMCAPDRFHNVWKSIERREAPVKSDLAVRNQWAGVLEPPPAAAVENTWSPRPAPAAARANMWSARRDATPAGAVTSSAGPAATPPTTQELQPNSWPGAASPGAAATKAPPAAGATEAPPVARPRTVMRGPRSTRSSRVRRARRVIALLLLIVVLAIGLALAVGSLALGLDDQGPGERATDVGPAARGHVASGGFFLRADGTNRPSPATKDA